MADSAKRPQQKAPLPSPDRERETVTHPGLRCARGAKDTMSWPSLEEWALELSSKPTTTYG